MSTVTRIAPAEQSALGRAHGGAGDQAGERQFRHVGAALAALPPEAFPLTVRTAEEWGAYGSDAHYEFVLEQFLGGLAGSTRG